MADSTIRYIFLLSALLIVVAYFVGASTDTNSLASGLTKIIMAVTGRNPATGQFAGYATGNTQGVTSVY
jgi:hypothetical protein